jgi:hypothetical protein
MWQRVQKLGRKFTDLHCTTGSRSRATYYLLKFIFLRLGAVTVVLLQSFRNRRQRSEIIRQRDRSGEPPLIAIKLTGGLGDQVVAARYLRDLAGSVEPFRFDTYSTSPGTSQWIFDGIPGYRASYSEFIFDELKETYPLAMWISNFMVIYSETVDWRTIRDHKRLSAVLANAIRFRPKISLLIDAHPYMDGYLAQKAVYMNLRRWDFVHGMTKVPYGGDAFEIPVSDAGLARHGLQAGSYITIHNGFDPNFVITAQTATKCYPAFASVVSRIKSKLPKLPIVQLGTRTSQPIDGVDLDLVDKLSIQEAAGVLKHSRFHIDIESGLVHLARCFGVRSCVLFGPTPADYFGYPDNVNLRPAECGGCWWINQTWMDQCPRGLSEAICMTGHDPERVAAAIIEALQPIGPQLAVAEATRHDAEDPASYQCNRVPVIASGNAPDRHERRKTAGA